LTVSEFIEQHRKTERREKIWLAEQLGITKQVLNYKFTNNSFTAEELVKLGKLLNMDLNKLKEDYKNESKFI
jgi:galactokinase